MPVQNFPFDSRHSCQRAEESLKAVEALVGLGICIKIIRSSGLGETALGEVQGRFSVHRSRFCDRVKRTRNARCILCDNEQLPVL